MPEIVFDIDGVLRDLNGEVAKMLKCKKPTYWDEGYNGMNIYEAVRFLNYKPLLTAPSLPYTFTINNFVLLKRPVKIWTSQPKDWIPHTLNWIFGNISCKCEVEIFDSLEEKEKELAKHKNVILCDDCPVFSSYYNRTILIDAEYNREHLLKSKNYLCRVKKEETLREVISALLSSS